MYTIWFVSGLLVRVVIAVTMLGVYRILENYKELVLSHGRVQDAACGWMSIKLPCGRRTKIIFLSFPVSVKALTGVKKVWSHGFPKFSCYPLPPPFSLWSSPLAFLVERERERESCGHQFSSSCENKEQGCSLRWVSDSIADFLFERCRVLSFARFWGVEGFRKWTVRSLLDVSSHLLVHFLSLCPISRCSLSASLVSGKAAVGGDVDCLVITLVKLRSDDIILHWIKKKKENRTISLNSHLHPKLGFIPFLAFLQCDFHKEGDNLFLIEVPPLVYVSWGYVSQLIS